MTAPNSPQEIVVADIGGTNARFALARVAGENVSLGAELKLTNSSWIIRPGGLAATLGLDAHVLINDFGAVAHAVAAVGPGHLRHICGPDRPLPAEGVVTVVGPGTGLGVAALHRAGGAAQVVETEGGHIDFAATDALEDALLARLRQRHGRVSAERIVGGAGLAAIHETWCAIEGVAVPPRDDRALWAAALAGADPPAVAALDRFCLALGGIAGDLALAQGACAVVIAGGLGLRLADRLPHSGFAARFVAKGRFEAKMAAMPVKVITHPQPGLFGAAAAFAARN